MFRNRWWVVVASVFGQMMSQAALNVYAAGVFLKAISQDLGMGRGVIASAMALGNIAGACAAPFVGRLLDRFGLRAVLLPCIVIFALATAARSLLTASVAVLFLLYGISGIAGAGQMPMAYAKMITLHFRSRRGLALGIALAGVGLGTAVVPQIAAFFLRHSGWRIGYLGLGGSILILGLIPVVLWFREPDAPTPGVGNATTRAAVPGDTFAEAMRNWRFWALNVAFFIGIMAINGTIIHVVPLLTDRGLPVARATTILSTAGIALIIGRVVAGYLLDKFFAIYIAIFFFICSMVGIALLSSRSANPFIAVVLLGLGVGAEFDLGAYAIGCYFGVKAFGALHGALLFSITVGAALGSAILGWFFQLQKSYNSGFVLFEVLLVVSCLLLARMGPYRYPPQRGEPQKATQEVASVAR